MLRLSMSERRSDIFTTIYQARLWGAENPSGPGSLDRFVEPLWRELPILFKDFDVSSILDLGCGTFGWIKNALNDEIDYTGCDIVEDLISVLVAKESSDNVRFKVLDAVTDELPYADLVVCRSVLFHLSNEDIMATIENVKKSGAKWLLTTSFTYRGIPVNEDIRSGGFRRINLELEPFGLPSPERVVFDLDGDPDNFSTALCLWKVSDL